jgi:anti-anti-sigma factor
MKLELADYHGHTLVQVLGALDESSKAPFDEHLHPLLTEGTPKLLVDLSAAERINSTGISQLVTLVSRANAKGGRVVLVAPTPFVHSVLQATRLTKFFEIEDTLAHAAERLAKA